MSYIAKSQERYSVDIGSRPTTFVTLLDLTNVDPQEHKKLKYQQNEKDYQYFSWVNQKGGLKITQLRRHDGSIDLDCDNENCQSGENATVFNSIHRLKVCADCKEDLRTFIQNNPISIPVHPRYWVDPSDNQPYIPAPVKTTDELLQEILTTLENQGGA